jgi:hypothetical protein
MSKAYFGGYLFRRDGRRPERRFNAVPNDGKAYARASSMASAPLAPPRNDRPPSVTVRACSIVGCATSQGESHEKRLKKILREEPDRRNRKAVAHRADGLVDVRRQFAFVREPHLVGGPCRRRAAWSARSSRGGPRPAKTHLAGRPQSGEFVVPHIPTYLFVPPYSVSLSSIVHDRDDPTVKRSRDKSDR